VVRMRIPLHFIVTRSAVHRGTDQHDRADRTVSSNLIVTTAWITRKIETTAVIGAYHIVLTHLRTKINQYKSRAAL